MCSTGKLTRVRGKRDQLPRIVVGPSPHHLSCSLFRTSLLRTKFPMDLDERPRKRRAINACTGCRTSKVKCDGKRPACQRCIRNETECQYHDAVKDSTVLRIEHLEGEVAALRTGLQDATRRIAHPSAQHASPQTLTSAHSTGGNAHIFSPGGTIAPLHEPINEYRRQRAHLLSTQVRAGDYPMSSKSTSNFIEKGLIDWEQASFWFRR